MSTLDFNTTILSNGINPTSLDKWDIANVQVGKYGGKDCFILFNDAKLLQRIDKDKIAYNPTQYRIRLVTSMLKTTTNFNWYLAAKVKFIYKDSSSDMCYATFLPGLATIDNLMTLDAYIDVKPTPELMRIEFKLVTFNMPADTRIYIQQILFEPSIAVDKSIEDAIQKSLPNMVIYANTLDTQLNTTLISLAFITIGMVGYANLSMHIFMQGEASADGTLQLEVSLDNKPQPYSPIKIPIKQGVFCIGLPLSVAQVGTGSRSVGISAKMLESGVTLSIPKGSFVVSIEGKNIEGGSNAEPPHAEVTTMIGTPTWGPSMLRRVFTGCKYKLYQDVSASVKTEITPKTVNLLDVIRSEENKTVNIKTIIKRLGDIFYTSNKNADKMDIPDGVICDSQGVVIATTTTCLVQNEPGGGGNPFYSFTLPKKDVYSQIISIVPENHAQSANYAFNASNKEDLTVSLGVTIANGAIWGSYQQDTDVQRHSEIDNCVYSIPLSLEHVASIIDIKED